MNGEKKWASDLHRTATTTYPCSGQGLGDSAGAGRIGLARRKDRKISLFSRCLLQTKYFTFALNSDIKACGN